MMWKALSGLTLLSLAAAQRTNRYDKGPAGIKDTKANEARILPGKYIVEFNEGILDNARGDGTVRRPNPKSLFIS